MAFNEDNTLAKSLRLFLSVDIAGSTAFKARHPDKVQPWLPALYRFFKEFPIRFIAEYDSLSKQTLPRLWKTLGDEMVFVSEITEHHQVKAHIFRFVRTIAYYRENIKDADVNLDLKGAAWLAGFPVHNTMLSLPSQSGSGAPGMFEDYIGPSLDVGFRLAKNATPAKLGLSVEAAYVLTRIGLGDQDERLDVFMDEAYELKGVLNGVPYPRLWTPVPQSTPHDRLWEVQEKLIHKPHLEQNEKDICKFCKLFIEKYKRPLFLPFINGDKSLSEQPDDYDQQFQDVLKIRKDLSAAMDIEEPKAGFNITPTEELVTKLGTVRKELKTAKATKARAANKKLAK